MDSCSPCLTVPVGSNCYRTVMRRGHEVLNALPKILDFPLIGNCSWVDSAALRRAVMPRAGETSRNIRIESTTLARRLVSAARPGDPPQSEHAASPSVVATPRTTSGKESEMGRRPPNSAGQRFSRIGEKNLPRRQASTLRSCPSCKSSGMERPFGFIHGATDANGR